MQVVAGGHRQSGTESLVALQQLVTIEKAMNYYVHKYYNTYIIYQYIWCHVLLIYCFV